jgi:hypothetical protein
MSNYSFVVVWGPEDRQVVCVWAASKAEAEAYLKDRNPEKFYFCCESK